MTNTAWQGMRHLSLIAHLDDLIGSPPGDYRGCVKALIHAMRELFPALTQQQNPVITNLGLWTPSQLRFIIREYSGFSNAAIHMLLEARIRNSWPALTTEIVRNIDEELGALTRGIPHLELMRHGYRAELGLETEGVSYAAVTDDFIRRMNRLFCGSDNSFLAGVLLAFEGTAVNEFRIVDCMLRRYKEFVGGEIAPDSLTGVYIAGHVVSGAAEPAQDPEMDHYQGMVDAVGAGVAASSIRNLRELTRGFLSVCLELTRWWEQLAAEAMHEALRNRLSPRHDARERTYASLRRSFAEVGLKGTEQQLPAPVA